MYIFINFNLDGGVTVVLGISDPCDLAAYIGCILATLLCVVYGIINWNKGGDDEEEQISEAITWHDKEKDMEEKELDYGMKRVRSYDLNGFVDTSIVVLIYLLMVFYVGYVAWKRTKSSEDYMVAGRNTHPYIMALSYGATFISTAAIVGFGGTAGVYGMGLLWLTFLNILVGIFIAFVFFGKRTRKMGTI